MNCSSHLIESDLYDMVIECMKYFVSKYDNDIRLFKSDLFGLKISLSHIDCVVDSILLNNFSYREIFCLKRTNLY